MAWINDIYDLLTGDTIVNQETYSSGSSGSNNRNTGAGGLVAWTVDNAKDDRTFNLTDAQQTTTTNATNTSITYNVPVINISGSTVSDSANLSTAHEMPQSTSTTPQLTTSQSGATDSGGGVIGQLSGIIAPVAIIGILGYVGYKVAKEVL